MISQILFCGIRFVPSGDQSMREANEFRTEHEILGHQISLRSMPYGFYELAIQPSDYFISLLDPQERSMLRGIDIQSWIRVPFKNNKSITPSNYYDD